MKKLTFWLGIILAITGPLTMLGAWFYFNQTKIVPMVKTYVQAGSIISPENIDFTHKFRLSDTPPGIMTQAELQSRPWRAIDGITPTDPLTHAKLTDSLPLSVQPGQIIFSIPIINTGILTFINPGDKITILDTQSSQSVTDILVLAKYDKEANAVNIMPSLKDQDSRNDSDQSNQNTQIQSSASLLLLGTQDQAMISAKISKPFIILFSRTGLTNQQQTDQGGGA